MANDPRKLRPSELCQLLNSTPLGEVIGERQLYRHRTRAGLRIGDGKVVDLLKYVAWLITVRRTPKEEPQGDPYEAIKERARSRNQALSLAGRDIGELPPVVKPARRARAEKDFRFFCDSYFPMTYSLPWSEDHLKVIAKIEQAVLQGGLFAMAMPRGSGKSSISECACIWAILFGHREFVCLIGSDEGHAMEMLESIRMELDSNDLLLEDFPEVCYPIQSLDGIANRCNGQLYQGERTHISWTAREIILPTLAGSKASGAIIKVAGITGRIRGMKHKRADGKSVRPSLVILDDPQTDDSARSMTQCATRESILAGAVLGLAGPGKKISGIMPCTVIRPGDMADTILNREKHPEWNGERMKMVYSFPGNEPIWQRYAEIRANSLRDGRQGVDATDFYRANRAAMDVGAIVAWPARFNHDELSAIQHAMNLKLQDEFAFHAEYQNEPLLVIGPGGEEMTPDQIASKINRRRRGEVPMGCSYVTAFIDVQGALLYWAVCAWEEDFTGYVIDYGAYPDQHRHYFRLRDANPTLGSVTGAAGIEGMIYQGLEDLTARLMDREWLREDNANIRIERCLIDANWGTSTDVVYQFCREAPHASLIMPSHGRYVGAASLPFSEYTQKQGDRVGQNWRIPNVQGKRSIRHLVFDTNFWKTFVHERLRVQMGDRGCLSLFGDNPAHHQLLAEHLSAEYRVKTEGRGRTVDEWKLRPERNDNHWLDCVVGCAVGASMLGANLKEYTPTPKPKKKRRSMAEEQAKTQAAMRQRGDPAANYPDPRDFIY